ncbi:recombinase family protein [Paenibacillaceae bacterium WGS1546]|uniref:recombinase family protein n=1 Tax=Cohnella sp. WGS1546 TaxID=3366810 RepID=UPI00372D5510
MFGRKLSFNLNQPPAQQNAIIYCRVSDPKQVRDGVSLELQEKECVQLARNKNMNIVRIYKDAGVSGRSEFRDAFMQMMEEINTNPSSIDCVIFYQITRLGRKALDVLFTVENLTRLNINLVSVKDDIDYSTLQGKFAIQLLASLSELESNQIKERVIPAMRYKAETGGWNGARHVPYGFENLPVPGQEKSPNGRIKKILTPIENESEQVYEIFDQYTSGLEKDDKLGQHKITAALIKKGYKYRDGSDWTTRRVASVLDNVDLYAGYIAWDRYKTQYKQFYNKETKRWEYEYSTVGKNKGKPIIQRVPNPDYIIAKGNHQAIISEEMRQRVKEMRATKKPATRKNKGRLPSYLLTGILICPDCKTPVIASNEAHGMCYKCRKALASPGTCKYNTIKEEYIIGRVKSVFYPYYKLMIYLSIPKMLIDKSKYDSRVNNDKEKYVNELKAKLVHLNDQIARDYDRYYRTLENERDMPESTFKVIMKNRTDEVKQIEEEIISIEKELISINVAQYDIENIIDEINKFNNIEEYFEQLPIQTKIDYFKRIFNKIEYEKFEGKQGKNSIKRLEFFVNTQEVRPPKGEELTSIIELEQSNPRILDKAFAIETRLTDFYSLDILKNIIDTIVEINEKEQVRLIDRDTGKEVNTQTWKLIKKTIQANELFISQDLELDELTEKFNQLFGHIVIKD